MLDDLDTYDTSDYPPDHMCYSKKNSKVLGKFKDETNSKAPIQFVGLRAKMYSLLLQNNSEKTTAKGVKRRYVENNIRHENFVQALQTTSKSKASFQCIQSKNHEIRTVTITKDALNAMDDKRYILDNGIDTLAHGHFKIVKIERRKNLSALSKPIQN